MSAESHSCEANAEPLLVMGVTDTFTKQQKSGCEKCFGQWSVPMLYKEDHCHSYSVEKEYVGRLL
jgi:hypothetical protein